MRHRNCATGVVILLGIALVLAGCETAGGSAALGGALGAGAGAIIGHQSHNAAAGALIGGALGALAGLIIHDIKARQVKNAQQTVQQYNYTPDQGVKIVGETAGANPTVVQPGGTVTTSMQYAVLGAPPAGITIKETRTLMQNGKVLKQISSKDFMRSDGTWESTQEISFPANTPKGNYEVAQTVEAPNAQFQQNVSFAVQ